MCCTADAIVRNLYGSGFSFYTRFEILADLLLWCQLEIAIWDRRATLMLFICFDRCELGLGLVTVPKGVSLALRRFLPLLRQDLDLLTVQVVNGIVADVSQGSSICYTKWLKVVVVVCQVGLI